MIDDDLKRGRWLEMACFVLGSLVIFAGIRLASTTSTGRGLIVALVGLGITALAFPLQTRRHRRFFNKHDITYDYNDDWPI